MVCFFPFSSFIAYIYVCLLQLLCIREDASLIETVLYIKERERRYSVTQWPVLRDTQTMAIWQTSRNYESLDNLQMARKFQFTCSVVVLDLWLQLLICYSAPERCILFHVIVWQYRPQAALPRLLPGQQDFQRP